MSRAWLFAVVAVFIATFAAVVYLVNRTNSNTRAAPGSETAVEVCEGCGTDEALTRFGWGRIVGETVSLPESAAGGPIVAITVRDDCTFCLVPVATVTLAVEQINLTNCPTPNTISLILIANREADLTAAQQVSQTIATSGLPHLTTIVTTDTAAWRTAMATDISPATAVFARDSTVIGAWTGFDPGHVPDLMNAIHLAAGCALPPDQLNIRSALATTTPGDQVPAWAMQELGLAAENLPATLIFSDDNCPLCLEMKDQLLSDVIPRLQRDSTIIYIDSTPSAEFRQARIDHLETLKRGALDRAMERSFPDLNLFASQTITPAIQSASQTEAAMFSDSTRQMATSLVGGTVPSAVTLDTRGRVLSRLTFSAGETPAQYLQRLSTASAAAAGQR